MEADLVSLRGIAQELNDDWWIDTRLQPYDLVTGIFQRDDPFQLVSKKSYHVGPEFSYVRHETQHAGAHRPLTDLISFNTM